MAALGLQGQSCATATKLKTFTLWLFVEIDGAFLPALTLEETVSVCGSCSGGFGGRRGRGESGAAAGVPSLQPGLVAAFSRKQSLGGAEAAPDPHLLSADAPGFQDQGQGFWMLRARLHKLHSDVTAGLWDVNVNCRQCWF